MKKKENAVSPKEVKKRANRAPGKAVASRQGKAPIRATVAMDVPDVTVRKTKSKAAPRRNSVPAPVDLLDNLGCLPRSYGEEMVFLVAQDPHWLFTYWDIDISRHPGGPCFLRVEEASGVLESEIEVTFETRNWYIPVAKAGGSYSVEIGFQRHGKWNPISRSAIVTTPRDRFSESTAFDFATLPMHLGFQRLVESVSQSFASSDQLIPALVQLQQIPGQAGASGFPLEVRNREILQALLGSETLAAISSGQWNSGELHSAIHQRLRESLSSAGMESLFSRLPQWQSESSLFSGFEKLAAEFSGFSAMLGSAAFTEMLALNVSSWLTGLITNWGGGAGSEIFARMPVASSWSGAELSSASEFAARSALSSWLAESGSSWKGSEVSLQALAAISSWSSEIMAAQGFAASSWTASGN